MTKTDDMTEEQELAQRHPPAWSIVFGDEDPAPYMFQDQAPPPAPRSSAAQHAGKVKQGEAEARHDQNLANLAAAERRQQDEAAHAEVMRRISAGQDVSPKLAEAAMRYQRTVGTPRLSSAAQLAARARRRG